MKARSTVFLLIAGGLTLFAFSPPRPYLIGYGIAAILIGVAIELLTSRVRLLGLALLVGGILAAIAQAYAAQ